MHETPEEIAELDEVIERSFLKASNHLTSIMTAERRLTANDVVRYFTGMKHLVVATVTSMCEPRCSALDGLLIHGHFWFSTSATAVKIHHLSARRAVSAAHIVGDDVGIFVHGHARIVPGATPEAARLNPFWREVYGATPEDWVDTPADARYVEILPDSVITFVSDRSKFEDMVASKQT